MVTTIAWYWWDKAEWPAWSAIAEAAEAAEVRRRDMFRRRGGIKAALAAQQLAGTVVWFA